MAMRSGLFGFMARYAVWNAVGLLLCLAPWASGEILRLSKVVGEGAEDAKCYGYQNGEKSETLVISNQAIVTRADVESVVRSPLQTDALMVRLTEEGGRKLGAATKDAHGDMRLAVLIDDEVALAPVVNQQLGKQLVIDGLKEYPGDYLDLLAWRIEGKSNEEIARLLKEARLVENTQPPPRPEPEYYNDEEYAALKKERAKVGMFYLDRLPTEEELGKRLKVGMTQAGVIEEFGRASSMRRDEEGDLISMDYELAPEKRSLSLEMCPSGFVVRFCKGQVDRWGVNTSNVPRQAKPTGKNLRRLKMEFPGDGLADESFGTVRWVEEVKLSLKSGYDQPHGQDYMDLITLIHCCATAADEAALIEANCSLLKTLAEGFSEVEGLRKSAKDGKVSLIQLKDLLKPYILGEKQFPEFPDAP